MFFFVLFKLSKHNIMLPYTTTKETIKLYQG